MKIKKKLITILLGIGLGSGLATSAPALANSNCCLNLCDYEFRFPGMREACLGECYDVGDSCMFIH